MPIKAKQNGSYKDVTDLMNVDESIDYVLAKTSSSYKRVYTATRSIEDVPPTTFKSIKSGANLSDYRIYGNTSKNILPLSKTPKTETIGDILCEYDGKGTFTFTSNVDNPTYTQDQWFWVPFEEDFDFPVGISDGGRGCIQLNNDFATEYGVNPYFVAFANRDNGEFVSGFGIASTRLNNIDYNYDVEDLEGLPANCIVFQQLQSIGKRTVTIKPALYLDIITQQPFEPYGESVGDRTGNLFDEAYPSIASYKVTYKSIYVGDGEFTLSTTATTYSGTAALFLLAGIAAEGADSATNGVHSMRSLHVASIDGYVTIGYRIRGNVDPQNCNTMLNTGSTPLPYEPYGYRVPVTVTNGTDTQTTNLYLPEQIKKVGDEAEYIDYGEQKQHRVRKNYLQSSDFEAAAIYTGERYKNFSYQDSKTPPGLLNYDTTRKRSTNLITIIGTYTISIANGWEFGIVMFPDGKNSGKLFTYNIEPVTISNCTFALQIRKTDLSDISSADISDYKIMLNKGSTALPYEPYIENTEVDVTLPALPTVTGTNTLSVGTEVQPSKIDITGHIKTISGGS